MVILMADLVVVDLVAADLVPILTDRVEHMELELVLMVDMVELNLVHMEDMVPVVMEV